MSETTTSLETAIRYRINDTLQTKNNPGDTFVYTTSGVFTLSEENIIDVTDVFVNDIELSSGQYSFDSTTCKLTITYSFTIGDNIEIQYTYYSRYSSTEIENYIRSALIELSINGYKNFTIVNGVIYPRG